MSALRVATDGGAAPNPGPAAWAWVAEDGRYAAGSLGPATNNIAELTAMREALVAFADVPIVIEYDSQYAANCLTVWGPSWRRKGVVGKKNQELIYECIDLIDARAEPIEWTWVRGHQGHPLNDTADRLAGAMIGRPAGARSSGSDAEVAPSPPEPDGMPRHIAPGAAERAVFTKASKAGPWLVQCPQEVAEGDEVAVSRRGGEVSTVRAGRVLGREHGVTTFEVAR